MDIPTIWARIELALIIEGDYLLGIVAPQYGKPKSEYPQKISYYWKK
jgi:hypothetical protein